MNAPQAFEVVASGASLIEWLSDEIADIGDPDGVLNERIWRVADAIRGAVNGSVRWEDAERLVIAIRKEVSR